MAAGILQHPTENCLGEWAPWILVIMLLTLLLCMVTLVQKTEQALVMFKMPDRAIHQINHYPVISMGN